MQLKSLLPALIISSGFAGDALADEPTPSQPATDSNGSDAAPVTPLTEPANSAPPPATPPAALDNELRDRIHELEHRVDEVEKHSALQRLQWSGDYRTTLGSYWYHGVAPDANPYAPSKYVDLRNQEQWLHRARLMIKGEPSKNFRFRGRFVVFKRFGTNTTTTAPQDFSQSMVPADTTVHMDRFWLDWFIVPKVALSVGRISYSDGSPAELRENLDAPDATWGLTMVNGEYETVDLTIQAAKELLIRGFYASWAFPRNDDLFSSTLFLDDGTKNLRIIGGNADLKLPDAHLFAQFGAYYVPQFRPFAIPLPNPNPPPNVANAPPPLDGSLVFPTAMPESLGSYGNVSLFVMLRDLAGFDLFAGGALGFLSPNGQGIGYPGQLFDPSGMCGVGCSVPLLHLTGDDPGANHTTTFFYTGARFTLPAGGVNAPKFGAEYNYGSRYMISFAQPTDTLTNKLANRGNAYEVYYIQPIEERAFLRFAWTYIDQQYTGGFFGVPDDPRTPPDMQHGGTAPPTASPLNPEGQHLHALTMTLHANF